MNTIFVQPHPAAEPPADTDMETWARELILRPATTPQEHHVRFVVADVLADLEAQQ